MKTSIFDAASRRSVIAFLTASFGYRTLFAAPAQEDHSSSLELPDGNVFQRLQFLVRPALLTLHKSTAFQAVANLQKARTLLTESEPRNWPFWAYVNTPYGLSLLLLGRADDAVEPLEVAVQTERRMRSSSVKKLPEMMGRLDQGMIQQLLKVELNRQMVSNMETTGITPQTIKQLLLDQSPGTMDSIELLVHAYVRSGRISEASKILDSQVLLARETMGDSDSPTIALEYRLFKMGASFSEVGARTDALRAFDSALSLNFRRVQQYAKHAVPIDSLLAAINVRRLQLSSALKIADFSTLSQTQLFDIAAKVFESKGLGLRYAERLASLIGSSKSAIGATTKSRLQSIEQQYLSAEASQFTVRDYLELSVARTLAIAPMLAELTERGLPDVFQPGKALLENARRKLGSGALIAYMAYTPLAADKFEFAASRYLRLCVTNSEIQLHDIGLKSVVDKAVFAWRQHVLNGIVSTASDSELSRLLLGDLPNTALLSQKWTIEPDGALNLVPFEALLMPDGRPWIFSKDMGYVTSIAQLQATKKVQRTGKARIIADPYLDGPESSSGGLHRGSAKFVIRGRVLESIELPALPESRVEAKSVEKALSTIGIRSDLFIGKQANIHALQFDRSPRFLHIATHGVLIAPQLPLPQQDADPITEAELITVAVPGRNAGLVVAGPNGPEIVYASDIALLPLQNSELVVFSACDSGNGTVDVGEGIASLRRAVETAGAESSITSLWSVPSEKTTELMGRFYEHLAKGSSKRESLRSAKLNAIANEVKPYSWAGFVFAGFEE